MGPALFIVDAFTERPFAGNPAAIVILDTSAPGGWMQSVAAEMNLSETAFVRERPAGGWDLRWFTPTTEVDLCGHATLASAHVLWGAGHAPSGPIVFHTRSGPLGAEPDGDAIALDFPATPAHVIAPLATLAAALGVDPQWTGRNAADHLVLLADPAEVAGLAPDIAALARIGGRGVIVTAAGGEDCDFTSRFFAPATGIDEDPVTGSAHCTLAPFWAERLGRTALRAHQASARGGRLAVRLAGDRVRITGAAVTVVSGRLLIAPTLA